MRKIRTLRHWKQQYLPNARFVFRRSITFSCIDYKAGDPVPELLFKNKTKLRRFWESKTIELAEMGADRWDHLELELPDGLEIPDDLNITPGNGSWYGVTLHGASGEAKLNGKKALVEFIAKVVNARAEEAQATADAEAAAAQDAAELVALAAEHEIEITADQVRAWTEDERAAVDLYLEALGDDDAETPEEIPAVLPQPPTELEVAITEFISAAAEHNIEVSPELAESMTEDQWDLSLQYFALKTENPEADLEYPPWLPAPTDGS